MLVVFEGDSYEKTLTPVKEQENYHDAGYGAIRIGDLLTSSPTPGQAMLAYDPTAGTILGKALGNLEAGSGQIRMLVMLR